MLKYCAWCGSFQGEAEGEGYQIRRNVCEIDTATICPPCHERVIDEHHAEQAGHRHV